MIQEYRFNPTDPSQSLCSCDDAQLFTPFGLRRLADGSWAVLPDAAKVVGLPAGCSAVAFHRWQGERILIARPVDSGMELYWASMPQIGSEIDTVALRSVGMVPDISCVVVSDNSVVIGTSQGIYVVLYELDTYTLFPPEQPMPVLQFGLQTAGVLLTSERVVTDSVSLPSSTSYTGNGSSQVHPSASASHDETLNLSRILLDSYAAAVDNQATAHGYLTRPFMLRYALRLAGGDYLWVSQPMMMLPSVLPPRIGVTVADNPSGGATISIDLSQNRYFQLRYRSRSLPDSAWAKVVVAVDVFVSRSVPTYDSKAASQGYLTDYREMVDAAGSAGTLRGRHPSRGAEEGVFQGHYSDGGDVYVDHMLSDTARSCWFVAPNSRMFDTLLTADSYYRVASLTYSALSVMDAFSPLPLATADFSALESHRLLPADAGSPRVMPSAMSLQADRLVVASDRAWLPAPGALSSSAPFYGAAAGAAADVSVTVYASHRGVVSAVTSTGPGMGVDLSAHVPHYLRYPDADAFLMVLRQGDRCRVLPLTADERGTGAVWCSLNNSEGDVSDIPAGDFSDLIASPACVYTGGVFVLDPVPVRVAADTVRALAPAVRAPRSGQFGVYPMYAFTSSGVYMLRYDDAAGRFVSARPLNAECCSGRSVVTDSVGRVYYTADSALKVIEGSDSRDISSPLLSVLDVESLPGAVSLLSRHGLRQVSVEASELFADPALVYDRASGVILVSQPGSGMALAYVVEGASWSSIDLDVEGSVCGAEGWMTSSAGITALDGDCSRTVASLTRPIKFGHPASGRSLSATDHLGVLPERVDVMVYATNDLRRWRLAASSNGALCPVADTATYRYWSVLSLARADATHRFDGLLSESF